MVTSNDAAVNTGMSHFPHPNPFPFYHKKIKNLVSHGNWIENWPNSCK